jgi:methionine-rich copper-binding protein CopC
MKQKSYFSLVIILAFGLLISGCNLGAAPTPDPTAQQATVDAAVAQALLEFSANQTNTAAALPTFTATATQEPAATFTPAATATLFIPTATWMPVTPQPTLTPTAAAYSCELRSTSPASGTKINVKGNYDATWVVKNVGIKPWEVGYFDLQYVSGEKMQTVADIFDVSSVVAPGKELTLVVDMKAPSTAGKYTAKWALVLGETILCTLPVSIEAVNP